MRILTIVLYGVISAYVTIVVGRILFRNGRPFLFEIFDNATLTDAVNRILLTGYYLINLGYVSYLLTLHQPVISIDDLIVSLSNSVSRIIITLGAMHYFNILGFTLWKKFTSNNFH
jgi:hypothetical protein